MSEPCVLASELSVPVNQKQKKSGFQFKGIPTKKVEEIWPVLHKECSSEKCEVFGWNDSWNTLDWFSCTEESNSQQTASDTNKKFGKVSVQLHTLWQCLQCFSLLKNSVELDKELVVLRTKKTFAEFRKSSETFWCFSALDHHSVVCLVRNKNKSVKKTLWLSLLPHITKGFPLRRNRWLIERLDQYQLYLRVQEQCNFPSEIVLRKLTYPGSHDLIDWKRRFFFSGSATK